MMPEESRPRRRPVRWALLFGVVCGAFLLLAALVFLTRSSSPVDLAPAPETVVIPQSAAPVDPPSPSAEKESRKDPYRLSVTLNASFYSTFSENAEIARLAEETGIRNLAERLSAHVARNLVWNLDMRREVYPGDVLDLLFRVVPSDEQARRADLPDEIELLALRYRSIKLGREMRIYQFKASDWPFPAYYHADGTRVEKMMKNAPLKEWIQITALLRDRRPRHDGIDFKAPVGTPIYASWGGIVERTNWNTRYNGHSLSARLDTDPPVWMVLLHLDKALLKPGQRFRAGDHIADVGNTGRSFAPHLHYQLQYDSSKTRRIIDPLKYHGTATAKLPQKDEAAFRDAVAQYDRALGHAK